MIDLSELNYKQLIELEKEIQKEKENKIHKHVTSSIFLKYMKGELNGSFESKEAY